jgi:hypothetical protein
MTPDCLLHEVTSLSSHIELLVRYHLTRNLSKILVNSTLRKHPTWIRRHVRPLLIFAPIPSAHSGRGYPKCQHPIQTTSNTLHTSLAEANISAPALAMVVEMRRQIRDYIGHFPSDSNATYENAEDLKRTRHLLFALLDKVIEIEDQPNTSDYSL